MCFQVVSVAPAYTGVATPVGVLVAPWEPRSLAGLLGLWNALGLFQAVEEGKAWTHGAPSATALVWRSLFTSWHQTWCTTSRRCVRSARATGSGCGPWTAAWPAMGGRSSGRRRSSAFTWTKVSRPLWAPAGQDSSAPAALAVFPAASQALQNTKGRGESHTDPQRPSYPQTGWRGLCPFSPTSISTL